MAKDNLYEAKIKPNLDEIKRYISCGVTEEQLYMFYGISKSQWYRYKKQHKELSDVIVSAKNKLKADLICKAYQVAMGYILSDEKKIYVYDENGENPKIVQSVVQTKQIKADANMLMWLLINRFPTEFARDPQILELKRKAQDIQINMDDKTEGI